MSVGVKHARQEQKSMASVHALLLQEQNVYSWRTLEHRAPKERNVVACESAIKILLLAEQKQRFTQTAS